MPLFCCHRHDYAFLLILWFFWLCRFCLHLDCKLRKQNNAYLESLLLYMCCIYSYGCCGWILSPKYDVFHSNKYSALSAHHCAKDPSFGCKILIFLDNNLLTTILQVDCYRICMILKVFELNLVKLEEP